jgi:predicted DCC family thiol-disulfide oxidoreductase YuxK
MNSITVLYDASCAFCRRCVAWLQNQPHFLKMIFIPSQSEEARYLYPGLSREHTANELTVVDDSGGVYYGERAYLMCLYALKEYREMSVRLSAPAVAPFVKRAFGALTSSRHTLSQLFTTDG